MSVEHHGIPRGESRTPWHLRFPSLPIGGLLLCGRGSHPTFVGLWVISHLSQGNLLAPCGTQVSRQREAGMLASVYPLQWFLSCCLTGRF